MPEHVCVCVHVCVSLFGVCGCQRYTCSFMSGPCAGPLGRHAKAVRRGGEGGDEEETTRGGEVAIKPSPPKD